MFAILNLETNELTLTEPNERVLHNYQKPLTQQTNSLLVRSQTDEFGIYIIDDTKTNCYDMSLSLFVGIDDNFKTRILELCCTLKATNNLIPLVLFTDGDPAMIAAVHTIYS
ncbi:unnamed protein product [Rhizophagus irregularis]|uniref:MULE transposase domain-containing protein n=1 Tax=Rhizophagus irregularis TaxID=588596 RepID=A0A2I1HE27_9GLOM|nr:hypothetical protein RhiirA4_478002 [Rhizophagus irregularis]CAB4444535.1 unnamed protein product [Rhizophagus irregularis]